MKIWKASTADNKFSKLIRERDKVCQRCGKKGRLECSHYWSRGFWATRYNFDNCIALCCFCHAGNIKGWEYEKEEYRDFMIKKLGLSKYKELEALHYKDIKKRDAIKAFQEWYKYGGNL